MMMQHDTEYICVCETWDEPVLYPIAELIRCKDCRFWEQERRDKEFGDCMYHLSLTQTSDFCSYAERKEE